MKGDHLEAANYVPILPALPADTEGAAQVTDDAIGVIRPLFVIVKSRNRNSDTSPHFVVKAANRIIDCWSQKGTPFVELFDEPNADDPGWFPDSHTLVLLHRYLRSRGVCSIPVVTTDRSGDYLLAFIDVVRANNCGLCCRLYEDDLELPRVTLERIAEIGTSADCGNSQIDLIIDLKRILPNRLATLRSLVLDFLSATDQVQPFRSLVIAGSSLPEGLKGIPENGERDVPRLEFSLWKEIRSFRGKRRAPALGDYCSVRPEYDDRRSGFTHLNGKLFYTWEGGTRVFRGQSRAKCKLHLQYREIAKRVVNNDVFAGSARSWGDRQISHSATRFRVSGRPGLWISYSTSHHIEVVAAQATREIAAAEA